MARKSKNRQYTETTSFMKEDVKCENCKIAPPNNVSYGDVFFCSCGIRYVMVMGGDLLKISEEKSENYG